jgi:nitronate monooxygenase
MSGGDQFLRMLGISHPIIQAPMAGGATTPELVAAVSNAGGLGSLGAAFLKPDQIAADIRRIRSLTSQPFNVNLFAGGYTETTLLEAGPMLDILAGVHQTLELPAPTLPVVPPDPFQDQLEAVLEARPAVFSFTFGIPDAAAMARLTSAGIVTIGTATTVEEGRRLEAAGVTAITAQGAEAGGHRGTFAGSFESSMVPTLELVRTLRAVVSIPVIASGGLMDGGDITKSMAAGAIAGQLGTAFLTCKESGVAESYKRALLAARVDTTVITRAFSGRHARAVANDFIALLNGHENAILPFPLQNTLTRPMRNAAAIQDQPSYLSLFAGQRVTRVRPLPAAELIQQLVAEIVSTTSTSLAGQ